MPTVGTSSIKPGKQAKRRAGEVHTTKARVQAMHQIVLTPHLAITWTRQAKPTKGRAITGPSIQIAVRKMKPIADLLTRGIM